MNEVILNQQSKNILAIATPKITTYTHHTHLLSILGTYERTTSWIYCNYINIYGNADFSRNAWVDFYFPMPYLLRPAECCEWLTTQKMQRSFLTNGKQSFWEFLKYAIDEGFYVHTMLNYFHIPAAIDFKKTHRLHDVLIYGYDLDKKEIYANDFLINGESSFNVWEYQSFTIPIEHLDSAFNDYSQVADQDFIKGNIFLYQIKEGSDYGVDPRTEAVFASIRTYLDAAVLEYWKHYNCDNRKATVFGFDIYQSMIAYLESRPPHIDTRSFNLLADHKKLMTQRMDIIIGQRQLDKASLQAFQDIEMQMKKIFNFLIKYNLTKQEKALMNAIQEVKRVAENEYDLLSFILTEGT